MKTPLASSVNIFTVGRNSGVQYRWEMIKTRIDAPGVADGKQL
jgi:hypothetical protein